MRCACVHVWCAFGAPQAIKKKAQKKTRKMSRASRCMCVVCYTLHTQKTTQTKKHLYKPKKISFLIFCCSFSLLFFFASFAQCVALSLSCYTPHIIYQFIGCVWWLERGRAYKKFIYTQNENKIFAFFFVVCFGLFLLCVTIKKKKHYWNIYNYDDKKKVIDINLYDIHIFFFFAIYYIYI